MSFSTFSEPFLSTLFLDPMVEIDVTINRDFEQLFSNEFPRPIRIERSSPSISRAQDDPLPRENSLPGSDHSCISINRMHFRSQRSESHSVRLTFEDRRNRWDCSSPQCRGIDGMSDLAEHSCQRFVDRFDRPAFRCRTCAIRLTRMPRAD